MDTLFWSFDNSSLSPEKYVKEVGILPDPPPPVGPKGQIWFFFFMSIP